MRLGVKLRMVDSTAAFRDTAYAMVRLMCPAVGVRDMASRRKAFVRAAKVILPPAVAVSSGYARLQARSMPSASVPRRYHLHVEAAYIERMSWDPYAPSLQSWISDASPSGQSPLVLYGKVIK